MNISLLVVLITSSSVLAFTSHPTRCHHTTHHYLLSAINIRGGDIQHEPPSSSTPSTSSSSTSQLESLLTQAQLHLTNKQPNDAFATLATAFRIDPTSTRISKMFEECLGLKVELNEVCYYSWKGGLKKNNSSSFGGDSSHQQIDDIVYLSDSGVVGVGDDGTQQDVSFSEQQLNELFQDRLGLSTLYIDKEYYDEASLQLRSAIDEVTYWLDHHGESNRRQVLLYDWQPQIDRAQYLLYRTNAACCSWKSYFEDGDNLRQSLNNRGRTQASSAVLVHPFDALKFPCISLELASNIASNYALRALESVGANIDAASLHQQNHSTSPMRKIVTTNRNKPKQQLSKKIRIGYISPDFTSKHPLAFLMQHVFRYHTESQFNINIYSISTTADDGNEVQAIRESSENFVYLSPSSMTPMEMYQRIINDGVDVVVDLCGYAGTSVVSEIMASRCKLQQEDQLDMSDGQSQQQSDANNKEQRYPIHVSYMGFPGSVGSSSIWDYSVFDTIVVPPHNEDEYSNIRQHYKEALVYMPHCYFVNSHTSVIGTKDDGIMIRNDDERLALRIKYGIDPEAFVYCCHSRPDKIDPATFRSWMRALSRVKSKVTSSGKDVSVVLWLLKSGNEMENNLRQWVRDEFGDDMEDCLVFANVSERKEHLKRLGIANVFLDTPAYNAHTLGCGESYAFCFFTLCVSCFLVAL